MSQPPYYPPQPLREDPTVLESTTFTVGGVTVIYDRGTNQAHRLRVGATVGEWVPPRYLCTVTAPNGITYAGLSEAEYIRNESRLPRVFIFTEEPQMLPFDIEWTTASLNAGDSEEHAIDTEAVFGEVADILFVTSIAVTQLDANGDAVNVWSSLDGAAVPDIYLMGDGISPFVPPGVGDPGYGPVFAGPPSTVVGKPIRNSTGNGIVSVYVENDVAASGAGRYTVRLRGFVVGILG